MAFLFQQCANGTVYAEYRFIGIFKALFVNEVGSYKACLVYLKFFGVLR